MNSQNSLSSEIILKTQDTLIGEILTAKNPFDKEFIHVTSFNNKLVFHDKLGQKRKIKAQEILELNFTDLKGEKRRFVGIPEMKHYIVEVIYINKIKWYKHYYTNYGTETFTYMIFDQDNNRFNIGLFNSARKKLKEITQQNPDINTFIEENKMNEENILNVIKMYEATL
ncbi:hypothetical protein BKP44_14095 [Formosa algae]|nr:hypothetical protein BKP44_14095 [Formosa algae]